MAPNRISASRRGTLNTEPNDRRGAMVVLIAVMMVVFVACVAFSVDIGYMQLTRSKLRAATDAAARAGGEALSRAQDINVARQAAKDVAAANLVGGKPLVLENNDIVFGNSTRQPSGEWTFVPNGIPINGVQIDGRRTRDSASGSVPTFFGRVFGVYDFQPTQQATVVRLDRDICLVVDRSSSMKLFLTDTAPTMSTGDSRFCAPPNMAQSRWGALSTAVGQFITALATTPQAEHVALVSYASNGTWCGYSNNTSDINQGLDANPAAVTAAMASLSNSVFNGNTNIEAGINNGIAVLTDPTRARPYAGKTMVLMTDGYYTAGQAPRIAAQAAVPHGIMIHTVTFGDTVDAAEMQAVSDATGGNYYHAPNAAALQAIFREIALTLPVIFTN